MNANETYPPINEIEIKQFLAFLRGKDTFDETDEYVFQVRGASPYQIADPFIGKVRAEMIQKNAAGAAIDVLINKHDPEWGGYTAASMTGVRCLFIDKDDGGIREGGLPPSALIETARGHHAYFKVSDCSVDQFKGLQERLIDFYGSDPSVKNVNRFMRVPGFIQFTKAGNTCIPCIESMNLERVYTVADVLKAYPEPAAKLSQRDARLLETISPEEGGRNNDFYSRARTAVERGADPEAVLEKVTEVAEEIGFPVDEALKASGNGVRSGLAADPQTIMARAMTELACAMKELRTAPSRRTDPKGEDLYQVQSLNLFMVTDLMIMKKPEYQWLVDGLLPRVGSSILSAPSKFGKSIMARSLAVAVANGEEFLGRRVTSGSVIYLGTEEDPWHVKEHFVKLGLKDPARIYVHAGMAPRFMDTLSQLEVAARVIKPALIIFDTMVNIAGIVDFNNFSEVYDAVKNIRELGNRVGSHVLCIHHNNKSGIHGMNAMMGSTAFQAAVDCPIACWEDDKRKWIEARPRYTESLPPTEIIFDKERLCWDIGRRKAEIGRGDYSEDTWASVTEYLTGRADGASMKDLASGVSRDKGKLKSLLESQVALGRLVREGSGKPGSPWTYKLPPVLPTGDSVQ